MSKEHFIEDSARALFILGMYFEEEYIADLAEEFVIKSLYTTNHRDDIELTKQIMQTYREKVFNAND